MSDLCAPPLEPLILQPKDKANLTEWFQSLWCTTFNSKAVPCLTEKALQDDEGVCGDCIDAHSVLSWQRLLTSLQTSLIGIPITAEPLASRWTWTAAPSVMGKSCWALTWRSPSGWITVLLQLVHSPARTPPVIMFSWLPLYKSSLIWCTSVFVVFMKVFNLLTSTVSVVINGRESLFNPAQSFMVPCGKNILPWCVEVVDFQLISVNEKCLLGFLPGSSSVHTGHAYSIRNVAAQPAVLYFTRIFSESSGWRGQLKR